MEAAPLTQASNVVGSLLVPRLLHQLDHAPGLGLRQRPAFLDHHHVARVIFVLLIMGVVLFDFPTYFP
jgi:hypothetical protein